MQTRTNPLAKFSLRGLPAALLVVGGCVLRLDEPIALAIHGFRRSNPMLEEYTDRIPDLLLPVVLVLSAGMWIAWFLRVRKGVRDDRTAFFRLAGTVLPLSYFARAAFKFLFGRIETRAWLEHPVPTEFQWLQTGDRIGGFPSGHMMVFASLAAACWIFFPRARAACAAFLLLLGSALIATNYHFLGDVIAGGYLGLAVAAATFEFLERGTSSRLLPLGPILAGLAISALDWAGVCTDACAETSLYRLFGVPLPPLGVAYFTLCGIACLASRRQVVFRAALAILLFGGLGSEIVFVWIQKFLIGKWCPMCVGIAFCVAAGCVLIVREYFSETIPPIARGERKFDMKRVSLHAAVVLAALLVGLGTSALGLRKPDAHAAGFTPEQLAFGPADSTLVVFIVSDWFCPACRTAEPEMIKGARLAMKKAKVVFVDYPIHRETLNYIPYNLSFMVREKEKYLQIREALGSLALKTKEPTPEDVQAAVSPLGVKYVPLNFADVMSAGQYQNSVVQQFKVPGTPAVVVADSKTGKVKKLNGISEINADNILRSIAEISGK